MYNDPYTCWKKGLLEEPFSWNSIEMAKPLGSFLWRYLENGVFWLTVKEAQFMNWWENLSAHAKG